AIQSILNAPSLFFNILIYPDKKRVGGKARDYVTMTQGTNILTSLIFQTLSKINLSLSALEG
ncbi:hypothetical protein ACQP3F_27215, partial [Escherichia coli]